MKRDLMSMPLNLGNELIIDNFAGGGGTSTGLEQAFGRPVDIAINHDPEALAMHAINHPHTKHLCESVWDVDPIKVTNNQPVGLVWLSPDCKHFSKAKGGKPVEKNIRGLAWVALRWVVRCMPRVFSLENVGEFQTWGPLIFDALGNSHPDPLKKGRTFHAFKLMLTTGIPVEEREGNEAIAEMREALCVGPLALTESEVAQLLDGMRYDVDHRELRACDYETPTIRKRFFMIGRRDGIPIMWPEPTRGAPGSLDVLTGRRQPYRTAAECIDWSIPCPSIFSRKKPLAPATLRRIAKGIMRYVVDSAQPFIVGQGGPIYAGKPVPVSQPFGTVATENHRAVVVPSIVPIAHYNGRDTVQDADQPLSTVTAHPRGGSHALAAATLVQVGYGEREGQAPRALDIEKPLGTVVGAAGKHALVAAALAGVGGRAGQSRPRGADEPLATVTSKADGAVITALLVDAAHGEVSPSGNKAMVAAFLAKHYTGVVGSDLEDPLGTVTAADHHSLVTAHITKFRTGSTGSELTEPLPTITAGPKENPAGAPHALGLVASTMVKLRGTSSAAATDEPLHTISAGGQHHAEVRAFLLSYYGTDQDPAIGGPLATVTSRDRFGLVTIHGQDYQIVDIGLRMLAPRELYRAQGFPEHYIIGDDPAQGLSLTKSAQVRMCGNSVCPPMARALIEANFTHEREIVRAA